MPGMVGRREGASGLGAGDYDPTAAERDCLLEFQQRAIRYFVENQASCGLILDRQRNRGRPRARGLCSTAATGMGLIALALASAPPHRLLSRGEAIRRIEAALEAAGRLPHDRGIMPHFVDSASGHPRGIDVLSTIDTAWLLAGALWSAAFLGDGRLQDMAEHLSERVDWRYWTAPDQPDSRGLLRHGRGRDGRLLRGCWDRLNGETLFLYIMAAGADEPRAVPASCWAALQPCYGEVAGYRFNNADLGLFVFQYSLDLLDLRRWHAPGTFDLWSEAAVAAAANRDACRAVASRFCTYRRYW
ncbi:MAG: hypothetical protein IRY99_11210, partial [Isosphaeraceae bacterium]|nr:hypothetical protein [Isosphaeraceae bacterium]